MDNCRFDNLTREVATRTDRRTAVKAFAGGLAALAALARIELGLAQEGEVGIESNCTLNGNRCREDRECCSLRCRQSNGRKRCKCAGSGASCRADAGCCNGYCRGSDNTCRCIPNDNDTPCNTNSDCCSSNCRNNRCRCIERANRCSTTSQCCGGLTCKNRDGRNYCL